MLVLKWSWYSLTRHAQLCLFVTPWPVAPQTPLFMGFSRQEYWSRLPVFPPGDIRVSCVSYTAGRFFTAEQLGKPKVVVKYCFSFCHWESLKYIIHLLKFILKVTVISLVQFSRSVVSNSATPWTVACQASLSITNSQSLLKLMSIKLFDAIQPSHPLSSLSPPAFNLSQHQGLFKWVSFLHQVAKYWSFSFSITPSNEYSGLISFRMDWFDLLIVQGTLKSLLQDHSSRASILRWSAFFIVQLSQPYVTTGKTIALTRQTFVDKVMSLLFNMLSKLVITFLPRSKHLLISWLQSSSAVILEPPKIKSVTVSTVSPSVCHEVMGSAAWLRKAKQI